MTARWVVCRSGFEDFRDLLGALFLGALFCGIFNLVITGHPQLSLRFGQDRLVPVLLATMAVRQQRPVVRIESAAELLDTFGLAKQGKEYAGAKLMPGVFERMKQPAIPGEISAGAILGPSALALVAPDARLDMLAELGVLFLLFNVGREVNAAELWAVRGTATIVATAGVILPLAAGWLLMSILGSTTPEAIFVGPRLSLPASVLQRRHWRRADS